MEVCPYAQLYAPVLFNSDSNPKAWFPIPAEVVLNIA
ncbi:MAG: hypothetical protein BWY67_02176 [Bacteroidetes bacterium ADurb.Bin397]|nr:MAG: hypothetical protein BWY67_02176 [Bacteroidetes bacterium ADurb.Bin397]